MELSHDFNAKQIEDQVRNSLSSLDLQKLIFESRDKTKKIVF
ncbi:MAG: hypothetical protein WDZ43_00030, partial [Nitrosopumilaceae archaeon]